ncbi:MAG: hypothetical protein PHW95_05245 [Patescibacteria group bacterium]|nr:hypothetical protein [Patescibacteria group bacterium]
MGYKTFKVVIFFGTVVAFIGWDLTLINFNPDRLSLLGFLLFYLSLFLFLSGTILLLADYFKSKVIKNQLLVVRLKHSIRQALFFTVLIIGWALLKSNGVLRWWNLVMLILILAILEFFFRSFDRPSHHYEETT